MIDASVPEFLAFKPILTHLISRRRRRGALTSTGDYISQPSHFPESVDYSQGHRYLFFPALPAVGGVYASHHGHLTRTVALAPAVRVCSSLGFPWLIVVFFLQWPACLGPASFRPSPRPSVCSCRRHRVRLHTYPLIHELTRQTLNVLVYLIFLQYFTAVCRCFTCVRHMYREIWRWKCKRKYVIHNICKRPGYMLYIRQHRLIL